VSSSHAGKRRIHTTLAPAPTAGAPYSQAVRYRDLVFVSGQLPIVPGTRGLAGDDIEAQTEQVLHNLRAVLEAAGSSLDALLRTSVYLRDRDDWDGMNSVYRRVVGGTPPARTALEVGRLAHGALIEMDAIAYAHEDQAAPAVRPG
jgi:2-iminobutanoate/2-iminopropanoate deaminase